MVVIISKVRLYFGYAYHHPTMQSHFLSELSQKFKQNMFKIFSCIELSTLEDKIDAYIKPTINSHRLSS